MRQPPQETVRNRLLSNLSPEDFGLLAPKLEPIPLELNSIQFEAGEPIKHAYFPERGISSFLASSGEGRIEVGMIGFEGMVGLPLAFGIDRVPFTCLIQAGGHAYRIEPQDLRNAVDQNPSISNLLARYAHAFSLQAAQTAFANAGFTLEARLARWILMTRDRLEEDELPLTHQFLSMMLGAARPGVTIAIHILEGNGLIRAKRGRITVLDRAKLEEVADQSYGMAEAEYERVVARA